LLPLRVRLGHLSWNNSGGSATQKNIEDEGYTMALNNLRSEVIELRNEGLEKDNILISLVNKIKEEEASSKAHAASQNNEIKDLRKQLADAKEKCAVAEANREASEYWKNYFEKQLKNFAHPRNDVSKNLWAV
jgi:chromosome segregation ATPase